MEAAGIESASRETQWETPQRLTKTDDPLAAHLQPCDSTGSHSLSPGALELAELINAWPLLSADLRQAILAIIRSADVIADAGLVHIKGLTQLERLTLSRTKTTDVGLVHLKGLTELQKLWLSGTQITDAGAAELQKALPNCKIKK